MDRYRSRWKDKDMRMLNETNCLYDIVRYYGGYLWYCKYENEGAFNAFYYHKKDIMKDIFINQANADAKKYFNTHGISGRRMRRILITGKNKMVRSYGWLSKYVEYILGKCIENDELKDRVLHILQDDCGYCKEQMDIKEWKVLCAKRLLGFQYTLLKEVSERKTKVSESALENINIVENSILLNEIIESCPIVMKNEKMSIV